MKHPMETMKEGLEESFRQTCEAMGVDPSTVQRTTYPSKTLTLTIPTGDFADAVESLLIAIRMAKDEDELAVPIFVDQQTLATDVLAAVQKSVPYKIVVENWHELITGVVKPFIPE